MRITKYNIILNEDLVGVLVKEETKNYPEIDNGCFNAPEKIADALVKAFQIDKKAEEYVYMIAMNTKCKLIGVFEISHGSHNLSVVSARCVYQRALLCGASNIAIVHNHPSGDVEPSQADLQLAERLKKAGELMDVNFVDSIIIGGNQYLSFHEQGLLS